MRISGLVLVALASACMTMPALALECANSGVAPVQLPDDTGDPDATACGGGAVADGQYSTALGRQAFAAGTNSTALGSFASAAGVSSISLGATASSLGAFGTALGLGAFVSGERSTALGAYAFADQPTTVIIGAIDGVNGADHYANVGMGTTEPTEAVDVARSEVAARFQLTSYSYEASEAPQFIQRRALGTVADPVAVLANDNLGLFSFRGYNGTSMGGSRATITAQAAGNFSASSTPTRLIFATTPVGQTAPQQVLVITPDGKVQVKGVNLNVPDYVFEDDYELMPLNELKSFIDENGHLPGIAPAHEVKSEGLDLAGSQMGLLQKVEELTLYTLQQQDQIQQQRVAHLEAQQERIDEMEALRERVALLESQLNQALAALD